MARLIPVDNTESPVQPDQGSRFQLAELERLLDTQQVDILYLESGECMVIVKFGKMLGLQENPVASRMLEEDQYTALGVSGPVLILARDELPELKTSLSVHYG